MNNIYLSGLSHSGNPYNRRRAALAGYDLPQLAYDAEPMVRAAVAQQGYALSTFLNDEADVVRAAAVIHSPKELIDRCAATDTSPMVRTACARR